MRRTLYKLAVISCLLISLLACLVAPIFASPITAVAQVIAATDGCRVYYNGAAWIIETAGVASAGYFSTGYANLGSGLRFQNVYIPAGAVISTATIELTAYNINNSGVTVNSNIQGELTPQPATFTTYANFAARNRTAQTVYWQNIPAWTPGGVYQSPNIANIIQAIVNQSGWQSGNSIVIFWGDTDGQGTASPNVARHAYAYSSNAAQTAKLNITYDSYYTTPTAPYATTDYSSDLATLKRGIVDLQSAIGELEVSINLRTPDSISATDLQELKGGLSAIQTSVVSTDKALKGMVGLPEQVKDTANTISISTTKLNALIESQSTITKQLDTNLANVVKTTETQIKIESKLRSLQAWSIILVIAQALMILFLIALLRRSSV